MADHLFGRGGTASLDLLAAQGIEVARNPHARPLTAEELIWMGHACVGVVAGAERYTADVLSHLPVLRCISRVGVGMENIDLVAAHERGIEVRITPEAPTQAVAEFTVALMGTMLRGVPRMDRAIRQGTWAPHLGRQLAGTRVGLIGLGRIGRAVATLLHALGCEVVAVDVAPMDEWAAAHGVRLLPLEELLQSVDVVSLHLPYSDQVHHLIDDRVLRLMRPGTYLVNTARGALVDEAALYRALVDGQLAGAALDVFGQEPYAGMLAGLEQVVLTAHAASHTREGRARMEAEAVENLLDALRHTAPHSRRPERVDREDR